MVLEPVSSGLLSFNPRSLKVKRLLPTPGHVTIEAVSRSVSADYPICWAPSPRIHSWYRRLCFDVCNDRARSLEL